MQLYPATILQDSPVAYYRLGELSGTTAADSSGNGNDGTYAGGCTLGLAGAIRSSNNAALKWNGANSQMAATITISLSFAVEFWAKAPSANWGTDYAGLVSGRSNNSPLIYTPPNTNLIACYLVDSSGTPQFFDNVSPTNITAWNHYVLTYNSATGAWAFFQNASQIDSGITAASRISAPISLVAGNDIGSYSAAYMDELAIYSTALPRARILAHYNAGIADGFTAADLQQIVQGVTGQGIGGTAIPSTPHILLPADYQQIIQACRGAA